MLIKTLFFNLKKKLSRLYVVVEVFILFPCPALNKPSLLADRKNSQDDENMTINQLTLKKTCTSKGMLLAETSRWCVSRDRRHLNA